ncbi:synaptotagmin C2 domain protein, Syn1 [Trifolium repens]|nr:synaptotagmin C2 domain protein, Syn1 [Trifolium repens]
MHSKINRKKQSKLNIIKICEEILNPAIPMALRLSGVLMGGVVIVYERKVKMLYDDVSRLLVEINEAWKVKSGPDPTMLPKGKSQAKILYDCREYLVFFKSHWPNLYLF